MDTDKKKWFQSLPGWLKIVVIVLAAGIIAVYSLTSCGNTKVLIRNADRSSVTQTGSDIEVSISADMDSLALTSYRKQN